MLKFIFSFFAITVVLFTIVLLFSMTGNMLPIPGQLFPFILQVISLIIIMLHINHNNKRSSLYTVIMLFMCWNLVTIITMDNSSAFYVNIEPIYYVALSVLLAPLMFFAGFNFYIDRKMMIQWSVYLFLTVGIISILFSFQAISDIKLQLEAMNNPNAPVTNLGFYFLCTLPWVLLIKSPKARLILFSIFVIAGVFSMKRSVIIILAISSIIYLLGYIKKQSWISLLSFCVVIAGGFWMQTSNINNKMLDSILYRFENMSEDGGSGRTTVYENVTEFIFTQPIENTIIGNGYNAVIKKVSSGIYHQVSAHNDFLEVLFDYGIIGLFLYLFLHYFVFKRMLYLRKRNKEFFISYAVSWVIFVVMSMVSHLIIYPTYFVFLTFYWGMIEALVYNGYFKTHTESNINNTGIRL